MNPPGTGSQLERLITTPGPKKLLSIAGGGVRGIIALEFLMRIEAMLREELRRPDLVLADYFDYVGGTSTGAIIATCVSLGYSVEKIRDFYINGARTMFEPSNAFQRFQRRFSNTGPIAKVAGILGVLASPTLYIQTSLEKKIKSVLGTERVADPSGATIEREATLGSEKLRTLLLIVMRNASTDSPWPVSNNPRAKYNDRSLADCNLDLPLWQLVRASTAAPVFFPPEVIPVGPRRYVFVDGGITVYNNPAFLLFLMATLPPYGVHWRAGERDLLLVSVGTGLVELSNLGLKPGEMNVLYNVQSLPAALIRGATIEQDVLCRVFGKLQSGDEIDSEIGSLAGLRAPLEEKLFTYARYNVDLSRRGLDELGLQDVDEKGVQRLDSVDYFDALRRIGVAAAERLVTPGDYADFLFPGGAVTAPAAVS